MLLVVISGLDCSIIVEILLMCKDLYWTNYTYCNHSQSFSVLFFYCIDGFHVTSNDDVCFDFFYIWSRVWQARKCGRWVEIGMKGRKYIVFWDGIGLKLI